MSIEPGKLQIDGPAVSIGQTTNAGKKESGVRETPRPTLYLCGPINGRTDADAKDWREFVKAHWPGHWVDPMARDYRGREMEPGIANEIVNGDLIDISRSDAMIVMFDKPSVGTSMEIFYAHHTLRRPIFLIDAQPEPKPLSPWLVFHVTKTFATLNEDTLLAIWSHLRP